jgi:hypothetical protein
MVLLLLLLHVSQHAAAMRLLAISVALQHPALSTNPHTLCAAARVCRDWRRAVHQSGARNTVVHLNLGLRPGAQTTDSADIDKACSFASWMCKHGPLVRSITVDAAPASSTPTWHDHHMIAMQLLHSAMQLATADPSTAAGGAVKQR